MTEVRSERRLDGDYESPAEESKRWFVRPMRFEDIDRCLSIWSQVELTEAHQTVESTMRADPDGFYVAELTDTGEVVGMCAGSMTRVDTAFMGFYAVEPRYQGIGVGRELWAKTMNRLGDTINVGLYGVPSMSEKYKKSGFVVEDNLRMLIFESEPGETIDQLDLDSLKDINQLIGCRLVTIDGKTSESTFKRLVDYDNSVQKFSREKLLRLYLTGEDVPLTFAVVKDTSKSRINERKSSCCARPSEVSIIEDEALSTTINSTLSLSTNNLGELQVPRFGPQVDIPLPSSCSVSPLPQTSPLKTAVSHRDIDQNEDFEILGYGCIRLDNNSGGMIGPIYADSSDICEVLLKNLMLNFDLKTGTIFSVMALSSNKHASKILTKIGLREMEQCSRMFTKFAPAASFSKIYYIHSPNFSLF